MLKYQIIVLSCAFCLLADTLCAQTMEFYSISAVAGSPNGGTYSSQGTSSGNGQSTPSRPLLFTELSRPVDMVEELPFDGGSMSLVLRSSTSGTAAEEQTFFRRPPKTNEEEDPTNPTLDLSLDDANLFLCLLLLLMVIVKRRKRKADTHLSTNVENKPV